MLDPESRPRLQIAPLLRLLHDRGIDWVLSGSTVLAIYGAQLEPNDLDVVPDLDALNLRRLAGVLAELGAVPAYLPAWSKTMTLRQCREWVPEPPTAEHLDHLFVTRLGMLDIPPELTGSFAQLRPGATLLELAGIPVWVCDPEEVLRRLPERPRPKDVERAAQYAAVRDALRRDRAPSGLARFAAAAE